MVAITASDIIDAIMSVLGDAEEIIGLVEIALDVTTVVAKWNSGDHFNAGYFLGKGIVNMVFTVIGIVKDIIAYF